MGTGQISPEVRGVRGGCELMLSIFADLIASISLHRVIEAVACGNFQTASHRSEEKVA